MSRLKQKLVCVGVGMLVFLLNIFVVQAQTPAPKVVNVTVPASVKAGENFTFKWDAPGAENCSTYGHHLTRANGKLFLDLDFVANSGTADLVAKHNNYGFDLDVLQVGMQCFWPDGTSTSVMKKVELVKDQKVKMYVRSTAKPGQRFSITWDAPGAKECFPYESPVAMHNGNKWGDQILPAKGKATLAARHTSEGYDVDQLTFGMQCVWPNGVDARAETKFMKIIPTEEKEIQIYLRRSAKPGQKFNISWEAPGAKECYGAKSPVMRADGKVWTNGVYSEYGKVLLAAKHQTDGIDIDSLTIGMQCVWPDDETVSISRELKILQPEPVGEPSIRIDVTDANPFDEDGVVGNDSQLVAQGGKTTFKVRVTNVGQVDLSKIVIDSRHVSSCAGVVSLPRNNLRAWPNFRTGGAGNHADSVLSAGEFIEYNCLGDNTQQAYTSVVGVKAISASSKVVEDNDSTNILVNQTEKRVVTLSIPKTIEAGKPFPISWTAPGAKHCNGAGHEIVVSGSSTHWAFQDDLDPNGSMTLFAKTVEQGTDISSLNIGVQCWWDGYNDGPSDWKRLEVTSEDDTLFDDLINENKELERYKKMYYTKFSERLSKMKAPDLENISKLIERYIQRYSTKTTESAKKLLIKLEALNYVVERVIKETTDSLLDDLLNDIK